MLDFHLSSYSVFTMHPISRLRINTSNTFALLPTGLLVVCLAEKPSSPTCRQDACTR